MMQDKFALSYEFGVCVCEYLVSSLILSPVIFGQKHKYKLIKVWN